MSSSATERAGGSEPVAQSNAPLFRSSLSFSVSAGVASLGGFIYWLLVAHIASASTVGKAAALYSSVTFVNYVTGLGLPIAVARYAAGREREPSTLFNWAVVATALSSIAGIAVYFAIIPHQLRALSALTVGGAIVILGVMTAGISIGSVLDVRLISQQRRSWVVWRSAFIGVVRLPFLFLPGLGHSTIGIFAIAAGGPALCGFGAWVIADLRDRQYAFPLRPLPAETPAAIKYAMINGAGQLGVQSPAFALPVVVLLLVSPKENASFYVAWTIAQVVFIIVQSFGQGLLVEGNRSGRLESQIRASLKFGLALAVVLALACAAGSKLIPTLYGSAYDPGARILPLLGVAAIPGAVFTTVLAATRVRHNHRRNLTLSLLFAVSVLAPAAILVHYFGILGAAEAWLIGNVITALASLVVLRHYGESSSVDEDTALLVPPAPL
jgi:O-antigen/teichoic acid export membrane protein